jgi:hypothetical protein
MRQLGNAAHLLGIKARDWDTFTVDEADRYLDWLDAYKRDMDEQAEKMKRS